MSEGGSLLNALKVKLLEEQKELQQLRLDLEKSQDELKEETEKRTEVNWICVYKLTLPVRPVTGYVENPHWLAVCIMSEDSISFLCIRICLTKGWSEPDPSPNPNPHSACSRLH